MEQSLLIMNYQRHLFGSPQTCLISISSSGCLVAFPVLAKLPGLYVFLLCNIFRSLPRSQLFFPQKIMT